MEYMVMECHSSYAVLLDEEGRFLKAANLHYEVGQMVREPVLMREEAEKKPPFFRWAAGGIAAVAACLLILFGVRFYRDSIRPYSSIYLSINPEVQMELNRKGNVVELTGLNEDGEKLLEGYSGKGKDKVTVADELIDRAIEMGFLSEGGQVSFSIDAPDEAVFRQYGTELRTRVQEHLDGRISVTIRITDRNAEVPASSETTEKPAETSAETTAGTLPSAEEVPSSPDTDYDDTDYEDTDHEAPGHGEAAATAAPATEAPSVPATEAPVPQSSAAAPVQTAPPAGGDTDYDDDDNGGDYDDDDDRDDEDDDGDEDDGDDD